MLVMARRGRTKSTDFYDLKYVQVFMRQEVKTRLAEEARAAGLSQSRYVERILQQTFDLVPQVAVPPDGVD